MDLEPGLLMSGLAGVNFVAIFGQNLQIAPRELQVRGAKRDDGVKLSECGRGRCDFSLGVLEI